MWRKQRAFSRRHLRDENIRIRPFGLLLRSLIRLEEGEYPGALLLTRKAAEAYSPEAKSYLADVYSVIFDC